MTGIGRSVTPLFCVNSMIRRTFTAFGIGLLCSSSLAQMRITFIDAGQADAALIQIAQASDEPFTIVVDGGDGDDDLRTTLPTLLVGDPTIELVVLSHPHRDHVGGLDWLVRDSNLVVQHNALVAGLFFCSIRLSECRVPRYSILLI